MLTETELGIVRRSYDRLLARFPEFTRDFHARLTAARPELGARFDEGSLRLDETLKLLMNAGEDWVEALPLLGASGKSHKVLKLQDSDYQVFGECLIQAIIDGAPPEGAPAIAAAWRQLYVDAANAMICA